MVRRTFAISRRANGFIADMLIASSGSGADVALVRRGPSPQSPFRAVRADADHRPRGYGNKSGRSTCYFSLTPRERRGPS